MGLTDRVRTKGIEQVRPYLRPGENVHSYMMGSRRRPRAQFLYALVSPILSAFTSRPHYLVLTNERLLVLKPGLTGHTVELVEDEHLSTLEVAHHRQGPITTRLDLRRKAGGEDLSFEIGRQWRGDVAAVMTVLGAPQS
jgi:hypothetical protein